MKRFALICLFASMAFGMANAQNAETKDIPANGAKIRFTETEHQYGTIQKGGNGDCEFTFVNEGNEPLILQNVKASCGCTTPSYTQRPVMPGQQGTIKVHYNTNNVGGFSKTVTVTSNAVDNPRVVLRIKGNVQQDMNEQAKPQPKSIVKPNVKPELVAVSEDKPNVKPEVAAKSEVKPKVNPTPRKKEPVEAAKEPVQKLKLTPEQEKVVYLVNAGLKKNKLQLNSAEIELSGETLEAIKMMVEQMNENPELRVAITGHTCNIGTSMANLRMGMIRAQVAKSLLVSYGVPADRIDVFSKGDKDPAYSNDTEEGRMKNRRVEIEYTK